MQQTLLNIDFTKSETVRPIIDILFSETDRKWCPCRRKAYNIRVCNLPKGYIYANYLTQPKSYMTIMEQFHRPIVPIASVERVQGLLKYLNQCGCYMTSNGKVTVCGTLGELWEIKATDLLMFYTNTNGSPLDISQLSSNKWLTVSRVHWEHAREIGVRVPSEYLLQIKFSGCRAYANNPNSEGHYKGDILVFPKTETWMPDFTKECDLVNNAVFATIFDQHVGGWKTRDVIMPTNQVKKCTLSTAQLNSYIVNL